MAKVIGTTLVSLLTLTAVQTQAATISEMFTFDPSGVEVARDNSAGDGSVTADGTELVGSSSNFDTLLGTLTGVRIEYSGDLIFEYSLRDLSGGPASGIGSGSALFFVDVDGNNLVDSGEVLAAGGTSNASLSCVADVLGRCQDSSSENLPLGNESFTAAEWDTLTSGAAFDLKFDYALSADYDSEAFIVIGSMESRVFFENGNQAGSVKIFYDYEPDSTTPVPLPAGMPLLLAGIGGFALLRRKRAG